MNDDKTVSELADDVLAHARGFGAASNLIEETRELVALLASLYDLGKRSGLYSPAMIAKERDEIQELIDVGLGPLATGYLIGVASEGAEAPKDPQKTTVTLGILRDLDGI